MKKKEQDANSALSGKNIEAANEASCANFENYKVSHEYRKKKRHSFWLFLTLVNSLLALIWTAGSVYVVATADRADRALFAIIAFAITIFMWELVLLFFYLYLQDKDKL